MARRPARPVLLVNEIVVEQRLDLWGGGGAGTEEGLSRNLVSQTE